MGGSAGSAGVQTSATDAGLPQPAGPTQIGSLTEPGGVRPDGASASSAPGGAAQGDTGGGAATADSVPTFAAPIGASQSVADGSGAVHGDAALGGSGQGGAAFFGAETSGFLWTGAALSGADPSGADLSGAEPSGADPGGADPSGADPSGATLKSAALGGSAPGGAGMNSAPPSATVSAITAPVITAPLGAAPLGAARAGAQSGAANFAVAALGDSGLVEAVAGTGSDARIAAGTSATTTTSASSAASTASAGTIVAAAAARDGRSGAAPATAPDASAVAVVTRDPTALDPAVSMGSTVPGTVVGASAPAAVSPTIALPASTPTPLAAQVVRPLFTLAAAGAGEHTLSISVTPDNLGPVLVRAQISAGSMRLELFAPTDAAREALRLILPDLRRDLAGGGLPASLDLSSRSQPGDPGQSGAQDRAAAGQGNPGHGADAGRPHDRPRTAVPDPWLRSSVLASADVAGGSADDAGVRSQRGRVDVLA